MLSKRPFAVLRSSECQRSLFQSSTNAQCSRCFHFFSRDLANGPTEDDDPGTPINTPKRGSSRHQRAAKVSNEVSMLQRGPPPSGELSGPGSVTGVYHAPPQAPTSSAGFLETPDELTNKTMGDNVSSGREGPNVQGNGRLVRYDNGRSAPRNKTTPNDQSSVEEWREDGGSALNAANNTSAHHREWLTRSGREQGQSENASTTWSQADAKRLQSRLAKTMPAGLPYKPQDPATESDFLRHTRGSQIIAGNNFRGVIRDKVQTFKTPNSPSTKLLSNKSWKAVNAAVKDSLVNRMVRGQILTTTTPEQSHAVLKTIQTKLEINGTYLPQDGDKLLAKVRAILPQAIPAREKNQPGKQKP